MQKTILYIHGMCGSPKGRTARALARKFDGKRFKGSNGEDITVKVECPAYSFDPDTGHQQIAEAVERYHPDLVIANSLGAFHGLDIHGVPHIFISPAFGAGKAISRVGRVMGWCRPLHRLVERKLPKPTSPVMQKVEADPDLWKRYESLSKKILQSCADREPDKAFGIYAEKDKLRMAGVVSTRTWKRLFPNGDYVDIKGATHHFSNYDVMKVVAPKAKEYLGITQ